MKKDMSSEPKPSAEPFAAVKRILKWCDKVAAMSHHPDILKAIDEIKAAEERVAEWRALLSCAEDCVKRNRDRNQPPFYELEAAIADIEGKP